MASYNDFKKCFNKNMTSRKALRTYTTLLKTVQPSEREDLQKAYHEVDDLILKRDFEEAKKGYVF